MSLPWERCLRAPTPLQARLHFVLEREPLVISKLLYRTVPWGKAQRRAKPESTTKEVVKTEAPARCLSSSKWTRERWRVASGHKLSGGAWSAFCARHAGKSSGGLSP